jgi:WD40 repeat protein
VTSLCIGRICTSLNPWPWGSGRELTQLPGHENGVLGAVFSPDGKWVGSWSCGPCDRGVRLWEAATGRELVRLEGHEGLVMGVAFSRDGRHVTSGAADRTVRVWEVATGTEIARYCTAYKVGALWWSPDGRIIKAADRGGATHRPHVYELELVGSGD